MWKSHENLLFVTLPNACGALGFAALSFLLDRLFPDVEELGVLGGLLVFHELAKLLKGGF